MKALLVSLSLLPGLALGQFLPTSSSATFNLDFDTNLNVNNLTFGVGDGGSLYVTGPAAVDGDLQVGANFSAVGTSTQIGVASFGDIDGGSLYITGPASVDGEIQGGGALAIIGVASFGDVDAGSIYVTGPASVDGALQVASTSTLAGDVAMADAGVSSLTVDTFVANLTSTLVGDVSIADAGISALTVDALTVNQSMVTLPVDALAFGAGDAGTLNVMDDLYIAGGVGRLSQSGGTLQVYGPDGVTISNSGAGLFDGVADTTTVIRGSPSDDGGSVVSVRVTTRNDTPWTLPEQHIFEACNGGVNCAAGLVYWVNPLGDTGQTGDAGIAGSVSIGGTLQAGGTVSANVLDVGSLDAGDAHINGTAYLTAFEATSTGAVNGVFSFDVADGGDIHSSGVGTFGSLVVSGTAGLGATTVTGYLGTTGDAGFNSVVATGGVQPAASGSYITFYLLTTHATLDIASVADGDCSSLVTETVTGALLGDACMVSSGIAMEAGGALTCAVTNTNEAKWQLCNWSGGALDHAEDTFSVRVLR